MTKLEQFLNKATDADMTMYPRDGYVQLVSQDRRTGFIIKTGLGRSGRAIRTHLWTNRRGGCTGHEALTWTKAHLWLDRIIDGSVKYYLP